MADAEGGLIVDVSVDQQTIGPTGRLQIRVTTTNSSKTTTTVSFTSGCQTDYEILDSSGAVITQPIRMCTEALTQRTLAPGASFTDIHVWTRGMAGQPKVAGPRTVQIRGILLAQDGAKRSRHTITVSVQ